MVDSLQKLTGLPGAWYLVPESLSNVEELLKLAERLDPNHESELRKFLHAGMRLMSLGNVLGQKGRVNEANFQDAFSSFLDALRELAPPAQLSRTVEEIILRAKGEPRPDDVVLEKVPPLVCAWLKAESAGSFSL